jgi:protein SCO1
MRSVNRLLRFCSATLAVSLSWAAAAHDGHAPRGVMLREEQSVRRDDGYKPPPPHTLGGPFELVDHTGRTVTDRTFRGSWMLVFFGYPGCREACPTGLDSMSKALDLLGPDGDKVQPLFIDFSMEEPDLVGLETFVGNFHPRLVGLTGSRAQTFDVIRRFKVRREYAMTNYSSKETGPRINHTTYFYLLDPEGRTRSYFIHDLTPEEMVSAIRLQLDRAKRAEMQK